MIAVAVQTPGERSVSDRTVIGDYNPTMFGFFRNQRRRKLLAEPMPRHQEVVLERNVGHYRRLSLEQRAKMRDITRVIVAEKTWVGCNGLNVTDEMRLTIAAETSLLLLGVNEHDYFRRVESILIYPDVFRTPNPEDDYEDDWLSETEHGGQAWYRGPVIVNWRETQEEARNPDLGYNVVIHEFAHQLDFLDGETNGTPPLGSREAEERWKTVMTRAFERHRRELDVGGETFFTEHAAENEGEFFADAAETFYCRPHDLYDEDPDVFEVLRGYFQLDPREWFRR